MMKALREWNRVLATPDDGPETLKHRMGRKTHE
jgi:hypothetical protein